ncbi:hypothetical protein R69746_07685 [Paraburkholderia aspalathi]|uniref:hypothetical protein n=1 Tax=Paraburkholderia aspalathi TaxID=1324617 RepID=UPI00190AADA6|nr:hypothetical protein [Paraburkholderia aspalathi]MBK3843674.1 hypothetical protein [Paraburkholderia aspalathi]CAE6858246.1 hypothetical protein R69746_07685 [Paraburkholderia aspalathi]
MWQGVLVLLKQFDWQGTLKIVLASSFVSSIVTLGWNWFRDLRDMRRERRDAALDAALSLEQYARTCRLMMHKADWAYQEGVRSSGGDANGIVVPKFLFPPEIRWKWLNHKITSELREFPPTVEHANEQVRAVWEYSVPPDVCAEVETQCAKLAKQALVLARMTRKAHKAAKWIPNTADADLEKELDAFLTKREERERENRAARELALAGKWTTPANLSPVKQTPPNGG